MGREAGGKPRQSKTASCQTHIYSSIKSEDEKGGEKLFSLRLSFPGTESLLLLSPEKLPNLQISDGNKCCG